MAKSAIKAGDEVLMPYGVRWKWALSTPPTTDAAANSNVVNVPSAPAPAMYAGDGSSCRDPAQRTRCVRKLLSVLNTAAASLAAAPHITNYGVRLLVWAKDWVVDLWYPGTVAVARERTDVPAGPATRGDVGIECVNDSVNVSDVDSERACSSVRAHTTPNVDDDDG